MSETQTVVRMQRHLQLTLFDLLSHQSFESISISDIAGAAKINRSTFYRYYPNKFDLLGDAISSSLDTSTAQATSFDGDFHHILEWVDQHRMVLKNVIANNQNFNLYQEIIRVAMSIMRQHLNDELAPCGGKQDTMSLQINALVAQSPNPEFAIEAFCNSIVGIMLAWIDHPEITFEQMETFISQKKDETFC
ncbi:TetR/AcrR family transcriptional regulator [Levilactobacillus bambusae]|uniref:HTH tetR-type domain-containing protein n=1 Tax=Levilactobacillus bambusae TaxID=2024736 RepID=A0A2V1MZH3_9LACO|nr:TetR/AcrR family transcriptional regulator [Levilactobacillus bambusae]PWG00369.1 hypothetical protein DCM90_05415 [Levilactobacillus bambusae]